MSGIIMPAGERDGHNWAPGAPEEQKMVRTASTDAEGTDVAASVESVDDPLLAAAREAVAAQVEVEAEAEVAEVVEASTEETDEVVTAESEGKDCAECGKKCCDDCGKGCDCGDCTCSTEASAEKEVVEASAEETAETATAEKEVVEAQCEVCGGGEAEVVDFAVEDAEVVEVGEFGEVGEGEEAAPAGSVDAAVEDLKDAVEAIEEAVGTDDGGSEEISEEVVLDVEVEPEGTDDLEVESVLGCGASTEEGMEATAGVNDQLSSFAMISPKVRTKLQKFWGSDYDYDSDYVALLLKDYEK
jgi:hypothetical protein